MASFALFARQPIDIWDQGMARLRGVEFDAPIVRSTNRGAIGWIGALGRERSLSTRFGQQSQCLSVWLPALMSVLLTARRSTDSLPSTTRLKRSTP